MNVYIARIIKLISNPKIFVFTIIWMMILVFMGTIAQKNIGLFAAQNKYFSSLILWLHISDGTVNIPIIPVPGGMLTMTILFINLFSFFLNKKVWKINKVGILITHSGAIILLIGSAITGFFSQEGQMIIEEGKQSNYIQNIYEKEFTIIKNEGRDSLDVINFHENILHANNILTHEKLPFKIKVIDCFINSELIPSNENIIFNKGIAKNVTLIKQKTKKEYNENKTGIKYELISSDKNINGIYISQIDNNQAIQTININNIKYTLYIRAKRTYMPFNIKLKNFEKIMHPGTEIAKSFSSEIYLHENEISQRFMIEMNAPLRHRGYTFYQASFAEQNGKEFTVLAVVKNYGRLFPYIASIIMCIGVLIQMIIRIPGLLKVRKA